MRQVIAVFLLSLPGCLDHACTAKGCPEGLTISFTGGTPSAFSYEVHLSIVTKTPEVVPVMHCSVSRSEAGARWSTLCASSYPHTESDTSIQIPQAAQHQMDSLIISVTAGGVQVDERMFEVAYTSREINGPGCGTCTSARIEFALP